MEQNVLAVAIGLVHQSSPDSPAPIPNLMVPALHLISAIISRNSI